MEKHPVEKAKKLCQTITNQETPPSFRPVSFSKNENIWARLFKTRISANPQLNMLIRD